MQWKGRLPENKIINSTAAHIDLLPTLVSLMGLEFEARREIHGRDLAGLILGMDREEDRVLFTHVNHGVEVSALPGAVRTADWRLVINSDGSLELTRRNDSGEKRDLADSLPGLADSLRNIYEEWFLPFHSLKIPPVPVGVADSVILPAHEGFLSGNAVYRWSASGWANDWATCLNGDSTYIQWPLQVHQNGDYRCIARYTSTRGATSIWVDFNRLRLEKELPAFVPVSDPDFSRIGRAAEAIGQTWARGEIGTVHLSAGQEILKLGTSSADAEILSLILVKADQ